MRLRFWYMIAPGSEGEFKARIAQYRESPNALWKVLSDGGSEHTLKTVGRWGQVRRRSSRPNPKPRRWALDFRIASAEIGEVWIDDVSLEPIDAAPGGP